MSFFGFGGSKRKFDKPVTPHPVISTVLSAPSIIPPSITRTPSQSLPSPSAQASIPAPRATPSPLIPADTPLLISTQIPAVMAPSTPSRGLERVSTSPKTRDGPSRVVVLLDGDSDYFHRKYLADVDGGRRAAIELHNQIEDFIQDKEGGINIRPVIHTMMFMNMVGLGGFLEKGTPAVDLRSFAQGFNSSPFASCVVDTGRGNQSADEALKNHLTVHIHTSDYLILGGAHDSGYAASLHQLGRETASKVIILQTTPVLAQPLADLNLEVIQLPPGLFEGREPTFNKKGAFPKPFHGINPTTPRGASEYNNPSPGSFPSHSIPSYATSPSSPFRGTPTTSTSAYTPTRPVSPTKGSVNTSSSSIPSIFVPLVNLLNKQERMGIDKPSRANVGAALKGSHPHLYTSFKEYSTEAERLGIVVLGSGAVIGSEWIQLALKPHAPKPQPLTYTSMPQASTTYARAATLPQSTSHHTSLPQAAVSPEIFKPLITVLQQLQREGNYEPIGATVGAHLKTEYPRIYQESGDENTNFKSYSHNAKDKGIINLGGSDGREWVALKEKYSITSSSQPNPDAAYSTPDKPKKADSFSFAPSFASSLVAASTLTRATGSPSVPSSLPPRFKPLVEYLRKQAAESPPDLAPLRSHVSTVLGKEQPSLFTSWKEYASEAESLGIVELGFVAGKTGCEWIKLTYTPAPFATTFSSTRTPLDWSKIPTRFVDLVTILRSLAAKGVPMPLNSAVKQEIRTLYPNFYDSSPGASTSFRKFAREAVAAGVIERGGEEGQAWVKLKPEFL